MNSGAGEDPVVGFEDGGELVGVQAIDSDGEDGGARFFNGVGAEESEALDLFDGSDEGAGKIDGVGGEFFDALIEDPLNPLGEADDADGVVTAGLVFVGEEIGLAVVFADGAGAALFDGAEFSSMPGRM